MSRVFCPEELRRQRGYSYNCGFYSVSHCARYECDPLKGITVLGTQRERETHTDRLQRFLETGHWQKQYIKKEASNEGNT